MTHDAVSESSNVNISSSVNATTTATVTGSMADVSLANSAIIRVVVLAVLAIFNLGGNGFTLITIRLTPRLWTKTNFILASMLVSNICIFFLMFCHLPFLLVFYVLNNPCHYNVIVAALTPFIKMPGYVSTFHLNLISIERYIAVAYPLKYETMFSDRTMKVAIASIWAGGILIPMTYALWLIDADLRKCDLIPAAHELMEVLVGYIPVCITMFFAYGKILAIWWRQRQRIHPLNTISAPGASVTISLPPTQSSENAKKKPMTSAGPHTEPTVTTVASADVAEQERQKIKSRRREFKAVYLTAAIVGAFVLLWFPSLLGRILATADYNPVVVNYLQLAGGAFGLANYTFTWAIYAAVSKSYRRAYRQMLIRIGCCCCRDITPQPPDNSLIA